MFQECFEDIIRTSSTMCYHLSSGDIFESKLSIGPCNTILKVIIMTPLLQVRKKQNQP